MNNEAIYCRLIILIWYGPLKVFSVCPSLGLMKDLKKIGLDCCKLSDYSHEA